MKISEQKSGLRQIEFSREEAKRSQPAKRELLSPCSFFVALAFSPPHTHHTRSRPLSFSSITKSSINQSNKQTNKKVQSLLAVLCEETQLAELEVRLGSFELHVVRSRENLASTPSSSSSSSSPAAAAVQVAPGAPTFPTPAPGTAFASTASMDGAALGSAAATASFDGTMSLDDDDAGVSTLLLGSPKVGLLRRGRYVKGKRVGKGNVVEEGAEVKKGQVLG